MNLVFEKLSQILAAGYKWDIGIAGTYFRLSNCQWHCTVMLLRGGQVIGSMENMLAGDYVDGVSFDAISIINGSTSQTIDVQISGGGAGSNRVLGEVSVIDGGKFRTMAETAKAGTGYQGTVAGQIAHVQLWNPAASGKNLFVEQAIYGSVVGNVAVLKGYNVALTTLIGNAVAKKLSGAASVAELRIQSAVSLLPPAMSIMSASIYSPVIRPAEPIMVPPGYGLVMCGNALADAFSCNFEFFEEPI